ncbi:reverse transcriptase domain-containing protein [Tanacetum coccineum]
MTKIEKDFNERPQGALPSNNIPNPREDIKVITTRSGITLVGLFILSPNSSSSSKEVERNRETTMDQVHISMVLLKKLPEKLRDLGKFLTPCDFSELEECLALADLGASINLIPLSVWKNLMLPELTPTRMTLELAKRSTAYLVGITEDVFVQVGKFSFPDYFVVVDYDVDPRVPLILGRPFLRMARALVDVYGEELTLRVGDEKLIFNKLIHPLSGSPTPSSDPIVASLSPSLTPFGDRRHFFLEKLLNYDPTKDLPLKELKNDETKMTKSLIEEPPKLEVKDLTSYLDYAFLEGTSKLPVIIAKDVKMEEKYKLIKALKSHKRAIAWKISNIRGIDPNFCTHKILMENDFKPAVQH